MKTPKHLRDRDLRNSSLGVPAVNSRPTSTRTAYCFDKIALVGWLSRRELIVLVIVTALAFTVLGLDPTGSTAI